MKIIGITGGIGSGKTTVARLLSEEYRIPIIDADEIVKNVSQKPEVLNKIAETFGDQCIENGCKINREVLSDIVFSDEISRIKLNQIIHPLVREEFLRLTEHYRTQGLLRIIYDVPLMIEENLQDDVDVVIVVYSDLETRISRIVERNGMTREQALERIQSQMDLDEKVKYADIVVYNTSSIDKLKESMQYLIREIDRYEQTN
ncbi:MAG: dephospho-CoA kinase [Anaerofustis sp.]